MEKQKISLISRVQEYCLQGLIIFSMLALCSSLVYAAISWPAAPAGETTGGKYSSMLVPSGAIIAFNLAACPTGWKIANGNAGTPDLRGEFIRGLDSGRNVDLSRTLASTQDASTVFGAVGNPSPGYVSGVNWTISVNNSAGVSPIWPHNLENIATVPYTGNFLSGFSSYVSASSTSFIGQVRPRNVALLYYQKN